MSAHSCTILNLFSEWNSQLYIIFFLGWCNNDNRIPFIVCTLSSDDIYDIKLMAKRFTELIVQDTLLNKQIKPANPLPFSWIHSLPQTLLLMKILNTTHLHSLETQWRHYKQHSSLVKFWGYFCLYNIASNESVGTAACLSLHRATAKCCNL